MATVTVNYNSKAYTVDTGANRNGVAFLGAVKTREIKFIKWGFEYQEVDGVWENFFVGAFTDFDTDIDGYESPGLGNVGVRIPFDNAWITAGKLDIKLVKVAAINNAFLNRFGIEPLNADGTVKAEFV